MKGITILFACLFMALGAAVLATDVVFVGKDGQVFDLADLRDGETRAFGRGDKELTATRDGSLVRLERAGPDTMSFDCDLDTDSCEVITGDDDAVMIQVRRTLECKNGEGDCEHAEIEVMALGHDLPHDAKRVFVKKIRDCEGEDCDDREIEVHVGASVGLGQGDPLVWVSDGDHEIHTLGQHGGNVLSCPEGDARIHVQADEMDDTFLCPKHSLPMKPSKKNAFKHRVLIERKK